jgi:type II secretory pathway pseudopilin PulG
MSTGKQIAASGAGTDENPEAGFLLVAVVVMAALVLIALSVAAPIVAKQLRRDKEVESVHRANEYVRAIQLYYRKNGGYPPSIKALESTNNVRYLRKQYVDPLTGKADWRLIHQGQQKTTIKGFFGKELAGIGGAGGGLGSAAGMQSGGSNSSSTFGSSTISAGGLAGGFNGATIGDAGATGSTGASGATGSTGSTGSDGGMFGDSAGGIIVGVGTSATGTSILNPNQQTTYETWEFWYDPRIELLKRNVNILGGGMASQSATSLGASGATGSTGSTFGNFGNFGSSGSTSGSGSGSSSGGFGNGGSGSSPIQNQNPQQ